MSTLLVYKNETPEIAAWTADFEQRHKEMRQRQSEWLDRTHVSLGVTAEQVGHELLTYGPQLAGISWPVDMDVPKGWRRNPSERRTIVPHRSTKIGRHAEDEMRLLYAPDIREELGKRFGVPWSVFVAEHHRMYRCGYRFEDGVGWVTWGTRDVEDKLDRMADHGWVRVPLVDFIQKFGEDAL